MEPSEAFEPVRLRVGTPRLVGLDDATAFKLCWLVVETEGATRLALDNDVTSPGALYILVTRGLWTGPPLSWVDEADRVRPEPRDEK